MSAVSLLTDVTAITEGLTAELAPFGIRVILFEPGRFRTNFGAGAKYAHPGIGYSEPYKDTPVERIVTFLRNATSAPGDPDAAASRMYEVVTKTGLATGENVKDRARFPLGVDAHGAAGRTAQNWSEMAGATKAIATSTDFKE